MKDKKSFKFSNNDLAAILVVAIIFSVLFTMNTLNKLEAPVTGKATSLIGTANITISREVSISFAVANLSFVDSYAGSTLDSYNASAVNNCATNGACGLNITNDGSVNVNISLQTTADMFSGTSPSFLCNLSNNNGAAVYYGPGATGMTSAGNTTMQNCASGVGSLAAFVSNLSFRNPTDWAMIDFKVTVPVDESAGYKLASVTFSAVDANSNS